MLRRTLGLIWLGVSGTILAEAGSFAEALGALQQREFVREYLDLKRTKVEEQNAWKHDKLLLTKTRNLYREEIALLKEEVKKAKVAMQDSALEETRKEIANKSEVIAEFELQLKRSLPQLRELGKTFPQPLLDAVKVHLLQLDDSRRSWSDKLKAYVQVLSAAERFQRNLTLVKHELLLEGGTVSAEVLYLGLGKAYFRVAGASGDKSFGEGIALKDSWSWSLTEEQGAGIARLFQVYEKQVSPEAC